MQLTTVTEAYWERVDNDHWILKILGYTGQVVTQSSGGHMWSVHFYDAGTAPREIDHGTVNDQRQQSDVMRIVENVIRDHYEG